MRCTALTHHSMYPAEGGQAGSGWPTERESSLVREMAVDQAELSGGETALFREREMAQAMLVVDRLGWTGGEGASSAQERAVGQQGTD